MVGNTHDSELARRCEGSPQGWYPHAMTADSATPRTTDAFASVLHPTDLSQDGRVAFAHALRLALAARARLTLLNVSLVETHWTEFPGIRDTLARWGVLPRGADRRAVAELGISAHKLKLEGRRPVAGIVARARRSKADLVVLHTHYRPGLAWWTSRSMASAAARSVRCPTLVVPQGTSGFVAPSTGRVALRTILVPLSEHPHPGHTLATVERLLYSLEVEEVVVKLMCVGSGGAGQRPAALSEPGWTVEHVDRTGGVVDAILQEARGADLVVMGTRGRDGLVDKIRGSTTERVLSQLKVPLLVVPGL